MLFNSIEYLIFFPSVVALYFIAPKKYAYIVLLAASLFFYASWNFSYLFLIITSIIVTYASAIIMEKKPQYKRLSLALCILINIGILFFFKYFNFFAQTVNMVLSAQIPLVSVLLPVGISFYTFQAIGYTIDVYRTALPAEKNILKYALFVSFFPQLVAGPIERSVNLLPQINAERKFSYDNVVNGLLTMSFGFFLKLVIADRLAVFVASIYNGYENLSGTILLLGTVCFAFQIYCDFFSYSTIAVGSAKVLGINLMENFKAPYLATSISSFWAKWHISLSTWFEDYIYTPFAWSNPLNKLPIIGRFFTKPPILFTVVLVFLISGLWHGAAFTFIIWGLMHGFYRVVEAATKKKRRRLLKRLKINTKHFLYKAVCVVFTFYIVCLSYIFFRGGSVAQSYDILIKVLTNYAFADLAQILNFGLNTAELLVVALALLVLFAHDILYSKGYRLPQKGYKRYVLFYFFVITTLVFGAYGADYEAAPFIYFQF